MTDFSTALSASAAGLRAQSARLRHTSENIANADTPGYRRKTVPFTERDGLVQAGRVRLDPREGQRVYAPDHPLADGTGHYTGSNVNLIVEIADAREARRSYEANLKLFEQAREMSRGLFDLLRR